MQNLRGGVTMQNDYLGLSDQQTPTHFFEVICPQVMRARRQALKILGGRYAFHLRGDGGGRWLLDFRSAEVRRDELDGADVYVELDTKDFEHLMSARLSVADAVGTGRLRWSGKTALLSNLKHAFLPA